MTSDRMINFINKHIKGKYKNNLIIMDNGGAHKSKNIKESILESNNMLLYSVPYRTKQMQLKVGLISSNTILDYQIMAQ